MARCVVRSLCIVINTSVCSSARISQKPNGWTSPNFVDVDCGDDSMLWYVVYLDFVSIATTVDIECRFSWGSVWPGWLQHKGRVDEGDRSAANDQQFWQWHHGRDENTAYWRAVVWLERIQQLHSESSTDVGWSTGAQYRAQYRARRRISGIETQIFYLSTCPCCSQKSTMLGFGGSGLESLS